MTGRALDAWWDDGALAGTFVELASRQVEFRYAEDSRDRPVSVSLPPDESPETPWAAFNFLDNLLPENAAIRGRVARQHGVDPNDSFGLLGAIGRECAGALILVPAGEEPPERPGRYRPLTDPEFERWLELRDSQPLMSDERGRVRLSLAGAQPKAALFFDENAQPHLPEDGAATTDIVKPAIRRALPNTVHVEWYCMELARALLGDERVARVDHWRRCLRVHRFDRVRDGNRVRRLHQEDLCQALGLAVASKYEDTARASGPEDTLLARCARLFDRLGAEGRMVPAIEKQALFRSVLVNGLLMNADAHLKNFGLLHVEGGIRVAPTYDISCTACIRLREGGGAGWEREPVAEADLDRGLALAIGGAESIDSIDDANWIEFGRDQMGLSRRYVRRALDALRGRLLESLRPTADRLLDSEPAAEIAIDAVRARLEHRHG
ncbi:MAG: HipA domain-containing protein [Candidatus Wenzhouxiangella sp. M2_3B_020]